MKHLAKLFLTFSVFIIFIFTLPTVSFAITCPTGLTGCKNDAGCTTGGICTVINSTTCQCIYNQPPVGNSQQPPVGNPNQPPVGDPQQPPVGDPNQPPVGDPNSSDNPFGTVVNPFSAGPLSLTQGKGLIALLSTLIRLIFLVAGIYAFIRIILGGLKFIHSGGDPKEIESAWQNIWQSVVGLVVIVSSFGLAALIGQIIFGNPSAILNPTLVTP